MLTMYIFSWFPRKFNMSRLIVKNLPEKINSKDFQIELSSLGTVTDFQLMYTKDGKFRKFGFIGYKSTQEAEKALKYLNKKMMLNQRVNAEFCSVLKIKSKKLADKNVGKTKCDSAQLVPSNDIQFLHSKMQNDSAPSNSNQVNVDRDKINTVNNTVAEDKLFVSNLASTCTEDELKALFVSYDSSVIVQIPINAQKTCNGFGFVHFSRPSSCKLALHNLKGTVFQGRVLHIEKAKQREDNKVNNKEKNKQSSQSTPSSKFNTLFLGSNSVADVIAEKIKGGKQILIDGAGGKTAAVGIALGEAQIVKETKEFLNNNGISINTFQDQHAERSKTVIIAKNLPLSVTSTTLRNMFEKHGPIERLLLAPSGIAAIIEYSDATIAKQAFTKLAYRRIHHKPLYLEWAPMNIFTPNSCEKDMMVQSENCSTIFVKNINFKTNEDALKSHFDKQGEILSCCVARKKRTSTGELLSLGYGFLKYKKVEDCSKALISLNNSLLDGHKLKLEPAQEKHSPLDKFTETTKLLVRNIPFQANQQEIQHLFKSFGELRSVRMPRKIKSGGDRDLHRGFAFVDFVSVESALNAFNAMKDSTHLYGRRLVLEWATM